MPKREFAGAKEILESAASASWGLLLIAIILGGIYSGVFTPTEAAAVAAVYAFLIATLIYRDMGPLKGVPWKTETENFAQSATRNLSVIVRKFPMIFFHNETRSVMVNGAKTTIMLMFIIVNALVFSHVLVSERIPDLITNLMLDAGLEWWQFLIVVNIILLIG
ncbi:MAG: C4-dicarboxylate transporter DctM subunit [Candidatus Azotimanducaceae bacterium]|jgi:C4-dicarboxylate transporter DctM subunit